MKMRAKPCLLIIISTAAAFLGYRCSHVISSEVNNEEGTGASVHVPKARKEERPSLAVKTALFGLVGWADKLVWLCPTPARLARTSAGEVWVALNQMLCGETPAFVTLGLIHQCHGQALIPRCILEGLWRHQVITPVALPPNKAPTPTFRGGFCPLKKS